MKRILTVILLITVFWTIAFSQDKERDHNLKVLKEAAKNGVKLDTQLTVNQYVEVQAVLIPQINAKRIFGKEIANNYAVIEVIVGNNSPDAALIIHGVFIDYRAWPLSGASSSEISRSTDSYQSSSTPNQVASEEYRIVRGQLLDAQTDTLRNRFIRYLTLAGNLAGAFTFSINEQGIIKGIAASTGVGIPGVAAAWPDKTIEQLNRVSDFGFQTNKVIPKQGSDIIVCFFPIDRFLSPGFRKIFLKSPALFFAPLQMLFDKTVQDDVKEVVGDLFKGLGVDMTDLRKQLPCYMKVRHPDPERIGFDVCVHELGLEATKDPLTGVKKYGPRTKTDSKGTITIANDADKPFKTFLALEFIGSVSLNRVTITVDGVMSVDVNTIAPAIDDVRFDKVLDCGNSDGQCFWTDIAAGDGVRTGIIRGSYLPGGEVQIAEAEGLGIEELKTIKEGLSDKELHFSFKLTKPVPAQTKLHFSVEKQTTVDTGGDSTLRSNTIERSVDYSPAALSISSITLSDDKKTLTVKGSRFDTNVKVYLHPQTGMDVPAKPIISSIHSTDFDVSLPELSAGCWSVQLESLGVSSNRSEKFAVDPNPTIDSAQRNEQIILIKGTDLVDYSACGDQRITFKLAENVENSPRSLDLKVENWNNGQPVLKLPDDAKEGSWNVQVLFADTVKDTKPLTVMAQ